MSSTFILLILFFMLICVVLFYVFTQQSLNDISSRLNRLQPTALVQVHDGRAGARCARGAHTRCDTP